MKYHNKIKLSVFDMGVRAYSNAERRIGQIVDYGIKSEEYGFNRFWLSEHHDPKAVHAYNNPDTLITIVAGMTDRIKVGASGVLTRLYNPYHIASKYKLLNNIYHNRIDLGFAKTVPSGKYFRSNEKNKFDFDLSDNIEEIVRLYKDDEHNLVNQQIVLPPYKGTPPSLWYLSTSTRHLKYAQKLGINYCISTLHNFGQDIDNLPIEAQEIERFRAATKERLSVTLCLGFLMEETLEKAQQRLDLIKEKLNKSNAVSYILLPVTPSSLKERLLRWQNEFNIDEFVLYDISGRHEEKIEHLEWISKEFKIMENNEEAITTTALVC